METKQTLPGAFKLFLIVFGISLGVMLTVILFSHYRVNIKYAVILPLFQIIALVFAGVGIYSGIKNVRIKNKYRILNTIGLIGNSIILLAVLAFMVWIAASLANTH